MTSITKSKTPLCDQIQKDLYGSLPSPEAQEKQKNCTHYHPDGKSSCVSGFEYDFCTLCGMTF